MTILRRILFSALLSACLLLFPVRAVHDSHLWSNAVFLWTNDNTAASFTQQCTECGETRSVTALTTLEAYTEATCMHGGTITKLATVYIDDTLYSDRKTSVIPKLAHSYTAPSFTWNTSDMTCLASWYCTVGGEGDEVECTVTPPTDSPDGNAVMYTASVTVGNTVYTDTKAVQSAPVGHTYGSPEIRFSEDFTAATASAVCSHCADGDAEKVLSVACNVTSLTVPATCSAEGSTVYTARASLLGTALEETKTVILPRLEHSYSVPEFRWNGNLCDALYSCQHDGEEFIIACDIEKQNVWEDCTAPGMCILTAEIRISGIAYTDTRQTVLPAKGHTEKRIPGTVPTCTESGLTDGFVCSDCSQPLLEQSVIPAAGHTEQPTVGAAPTCTEDGISDGILCKVCGETLTEQVPLPAAGHTPVTVQIGVNPTCTEEGISDTVVCAVCTEGLQKADILPAVGHSFADAVFTWSTNGETVTASKTCAHGCGTVLRGAVTLTTSSEIKNGITVTTASAAAVFGDGSTAAASKVFGSDPTSADPISPTPHFVDVVRGSYYEDAVAWAASAGITQGTSKEHFSPDMDCSRAQIVTMLWRAAGSPKVSRPSAFTDVAASSYYYHAVAWASEAGITAGTSQTTFSPDMPCSRAQIVTMLWRAAGCPVSENAVPYTDVPSDSWYADAVAWAVEHGITQGTGANTFSPDAVCTRAQIVTFLYRASQKN